MSRFQYVRNSTSTTKSGRNSSGTSAGSQGKVCWFWLSGRCNRNPCRFLHHLPARGDLKKISFATDNHEKDRHESSAEKPAVSTSTCTGTSSTSTSTNTEKKKNVCKFWMSGGGGGVKGDRCSHFYSWSYGDGFSKLSTLQGHTKVVTGIALSSKMYKLYSASADETVRVWDSHTGQCDRVIKLAGKIGSLINEGPWVFVGLTDVIKAWNIQNNAEFSLDGPVGLVQSMIVANDMLFAGTRNGEILAWRGSSETDNPFQLLTTLTGHINAVICLAVGGNRLFSGSIDNTIRVWHLDTLQCVATLNGHIDIVTSLIYCGQYLLSCSLDGTIKVWTTSQDGSTEVTYTHIQEHGALALCGIMDEKGKPILLCSYNDNSVRLYELPSFTERGRIFGKQEIWRIQNGPQGVFFTGDATGLLTVWEMA